MKAKSMLMFVACCAIWTSAYSQQSSNNNNKKTRPDKSTIEATTMGQKNNLNFTIENEEQLACKLTGPELLKRKDQIREQLFDKVQKVEGIENGYVFFFDYDPDVILKLTDWIIAENSCCPFFTFNTTLHGKNNVRLQMTGPEKAKEMMESLIVDQITSKK